MAIRACPDCKKLLRELQTSCMCGWSEGKKKSTGEGSGSHYCSKPGCNKLGTRTATTKAGPSTMWYCKEHDMS